MKPINLLIGACCVISCSQQQQNSNRPIASVQKDTVVKHDTIFIDSQHNWQINFGLTHDPETDTIAGKAVQFYISNPNCSPLAIDFYQGQLRPTDNYSTAALLNLAVTNDPKLRPFYRWCLSKTIEIQDGALAESTGVPARRYAEKFPKEFLTFIENDTSRQEYNNWTEAISYSGFYDDEEEHKNKAIRNRMAKKMKENCLQCSPALLAKIDAFSLACFP